MSRIDRQQAVFDLLKNLRGIEPLKQLFWSELNYQRVNEPLSRRGWTDKASQALAEEPTLLANAGKDGDFHVIYSRLADERLLHGLERPVVACLLRNHPYSLFVFSNSDQSRWHFINVKYNAPVITDDAKAKPRRLFRRITIGPEERLRTASERISMLDIEDIGDLFGLSPLDIQLRHDEAFNVAAVTKHFFDEYRAAFVILQKDLAEQTNDKKWAHDYALQFLNRLMFLYFVQRKRWVGDDPDFLAAFWRSYRRSKRPKDTFFTEWLSILFEAFNNRFQAGRHPYMPDEMRDALAKAPFLNGGLFEENRLDTEKAFQITDLRFEQAFKFFERYNFTITEDSPLDQEVAVDPEMIGYVYESLVNVSDNIDERGEAGIFYTPRTEIELMCRLALVDRLANELGEKHKPLLYELVFALEPQEKEDADAKATKHNLWPKLDEFLRSITVVDPACGSGSFLVGMLHVLDDLSDRANRILGRDETVYERRKRIIGQSLYGVDVMEWAVRVAELRLWLHLVIEKELKPEERKSLRPLLPNLDFKIRVGDSLVQEIGGVNLGNLHIADISAPLKGRIRKLKGRKLDFYHGKAKDENAIETEELRVFRAILDERIHKLVEKERSLKHQIESSGGVQMGILGIKEDDTRQLDLNRAAWQAQVDDIEAELERLIPARESLKTAKDIPFVWDIAFVEIFEGEREGFDIVIGNPPYVRQENISDPRLPREKVTTENKKAYKAKLMRSVYLAYPRFFGYKPDSDKATRKLDAKSDLYIYFYLHGLSLLNPKGSFCFITSNSWLDVGYGKDLQEFLLRHCHVKMILDNRAKRSFEHADVNTVICLFSAPNKKPDSTLDRAARFVMFNVPFDQILSPVIFEEIEEAVERKSTAEYRLFPIAQRNLFQDGCEALEDDEPEETKPKKARSSGPLIKVARYIGNKWGGKYLRAPDIYWTILEKGKGKLVRLGDIAEVRFGIKTGANEFFYLDEQRIREWGIEKEFLRPVIKSPRECKSLLVEHGSLELKLFLCHKSKRDLKDKSALEYIEWGESRGYDKRPSCFGRERWWDLGLRTLPFLHFNYLINTTARTLFAPKGCYCSDNFQEVHCKDPRSLCLSLNSAIFQLMVNMAGRSNFGGGLLKIQTYELCALFCADPGLLTKKKMPDLANIKWDILENSRNRIDLDGPIFDVLGLTQAEQEGVYEAVIKMVENRLNKAKSMSTKDQKKRLSAVEETLGIWDSVSEEDEP